MAIVTHNSFDVFKALMLEQVWAKYITCWNSLWRIMCHVEELISKLPEPFPPVFFCHIWHSWLAAQTVFLWDLVLSTLPRAKKWLLFFFFFFFNVHSNLLINRTMINNNCTGSKVLFKSYKVTTMRKNLYLFKIYSKV